MGGLRARRPASLKEIDCNNSDADIPIGSLWDFIDRMELAVGFRIAQSWAFQ
jgi:hypothetical protein